MTTRTLPLRALAATLTFCAVLLGSVSAASAGVAVATIPDVPTTVTVGSATVPAQLTMINTNTPPQNGLDDAVTSIKFVPDCGVQALTCSVGFVDSGVLKPSASGTGQTGSACSNVPFAITLVDIAKDEYEFTFPGSILLTPTGPTQSCVIDFTLSVERFPTFDANPSLMGVQTAQIASATVTATGGLTGGGTGTDETTVLKATPIVVSQATPQAISLGATFTDTATVSGVNPSGTVQFDVYGPNDVTCSGPRALTSTNAIGEVGGSATSSPLAPAAVGTYRVIARYSGDANNAPVATACGDPPQVVTVTQATPPPPPPPRLRLRLRRSPRRRSRRSRRPASTSAAR